MCLLTCLVLIVYVNWLAMSFCLFLPACTSVLVQTCWTSSCRSWFTPNPNTTAYHVSAKIPPGVRRLDMCLLYALLIMWQLWLQFDMWKLNLVCRLRCVFLVIVHRGVHGIMLRFKFFHRLCLWIILMRQKCDNIVLRGSVTNGSLAFVPRGGPSAVNRKKNPNQSNADRWACSSWSVQEERSSGNHQKVLLSFLLA